MHTRTHAQHWSGAILPQGVWLQPRSNHTAHPLWDPNSNPEDPCLVVTCGRAAGGTPLEDVWIFSINSLTSMQVSIISPYTRGGRISQISLVFFFDQLRMHDDIYSAC